MFRYLKLLLICLLSILVAACGSRSVYAPIDSRSNTQSEVSPGVTTRPAMSGRRYSTSADTHYVVKSGDTLFSIAEKYKLGYWQLANINGIHPPFTIYKGQRLNLHEKSGAKITAPVVPKTARTKAKPATKVVVKPPVTKTGKAIKFDGTWKWPTRGRLLRGYKPNEPGRKGISIGGHNGQPVKAAASGKVVYVGSGLVGYGRLIIVRHNETLLSTYGHNSKYLVTEGEYVKTGQEIAKMGSSGIDHTELYFEIRKNGKPVNPLAYLPKKH